MSPSPWRCLLPAAALLMLVPPARAQVSPPHVGFVYPAGGRQGNTFEVKLGGQYFDGAASLHFSGDGVKAKVLGMTRPLTQREINELRRELRELQKKKDRNDSDLDRIAEIRKKLEQPAVQPTPALAEIVTAEITVDDKARPGPRQLRLKANTGMSNPVVFFVGQLPEVTQRKELIDPEAPPPRAPDVNVTLPAILNSQIMPGAVDRYRFTARKGQQLVFVLRARELTPYLADAVPGWFQAALTLHDDRGKEVAYADHFHHHPDPVLAYRVPRDGDYVLEVKDGLYRGREDFVYRLDAGELPFITSIFPLGGPAKTRTTVTLQGWNLPKSSLTLEPAAMKPGVLQVSVRKGELVSNAVPFAVDELPEKLAAGGAEAPQALTLPVIVNGRIARPGRWDVFRFEGRAGQVVVAEVRARRLDSPLDSVLELTDSGGKVIAYNDDWEDKGQGLHTHHADSLLRVTLPRNGTYYLRLGDGQGQGGPAHAYRLRVSAPRPDFELRVTPCSINARPGSTVVITAYALRKDGFAGEIDLRFTYNPVDFALGGAKIPANQEAVQVTLQVPAKVRPRPINLVLEGRALVLGRPVVRRAVPAEDMMQAFAYHHLVPAEDLMVTIGGKARARFPARLLGKGPVKVRAGGTVLAQLAIPKASSSNKIQLFLSDPPEGISLKKVRVFDGGAVLTIHADGEKVRPGLRGNLILEAYPASAKPGPGGRGALGTLPAIPFEVLRVRK